MPITIGPFSNVPSPGDPITSPWPQQLTQYVVDRSPQFAAAIGSDVTIGPDSTWVTIPFTNIHVNIGSRYNGTSWTAPRAGVIRVTWSADIAAGNTAGNYDAIADYNANTSILLNAQNVVIASTNSRFGAATLAGSVLASVAAGNTVHPQAMLNAPGKFKTVKAGVGSILIEYVT